MSRSHDPEPNPNHNIWCNNGTYFIHVTLMWEDRRKVRVRKSLQTKDVEEARRRRDRVLECLQRKPELTVLGRTRASGVSRIHRANPCCPA